MDPKELLLTALRASFVYFFLLLVVRVLGKREIGAGKFAAGMDAAGDRSVCSEVEW